MANKNGLINLIGTTVLLTAMGVGFVKGCIDNYHKNLPGVVYLVNGKPAIERRFNTNEEFQEYLNSERGKKEQEYYLNLNAKF